VRAGVWGELSARNVRVNVYRRNLQRAFLATADTRLNPPAAPAAAAGAQVAAQPAGSDVRGVLRAELQDLDRLAQSALSRTSDPMTRIHLRDVRTEIARILEGKR
jgi:hypothetical protein